MRNSRLKLVALVTVCALVAVSAAAALTHGGGRGGSGSGNQTALLNDVADRLDVAPTRLRTAIKNAVKAQIDQQVTDGLLTDAQRGTLKERVDAGRVGVSAGNPVRVGLGELGVLPAAAAYLDLSVAQLNTQLAAGKSLADVAQEQNKTVAGLEAAIVARATTQLAAAVTAGDLTDAQRDTILTQVRNGVDELVQRTGRFGFGFGRHGGKR